MKQNKFLLLLSSVLVVYHLKNTFHVNISVKYSLAHNMRQGKNSHCAVKKVMHRKRLTYELHDSYFRSMMITPAIPKIAEVTHPNGQ